MLKNNLKIALRRLVADRFFSGLNVAGLAVGMAAFLLIFQFVRFEKSYDRQSPQAERIWRAFNQTVVDGRVVTEDANTHSALGPALKNDLAGEVVDFARLYDRGEKEADFLVENKPVRLQKVFFTDPGFVRLFPQKCLAGDLKTALDEPFSMILTKKGAERLFGKVDGALGKMVISKNGTFAGNHVVRAVVDDPPANTHLKFEALLSWSTRAHFGHSDNWTSYWEYNYFELAPTADPERVRRKLAEYSDAFLKNEGIRLAMQPLVDIHLNSNLTYEIEPNGSARSVDFLALVAGLLALIGFVNCVNLTTARSLARGREVGVRKAIGASKTQLFGQFLTEGVLMNGLAAGLAAVAAVVLMPIFSAWLGRPLEVLPGFDRTFWLAVFGLFSAGVFLASAWPAVVQSRLSSFLFIKNSNSKTEKTGLRKALVIAQFACSTALIASVLIVQKQVRHLETTEKGMSLDQVVTFRAAQQDWSRPDSLNQRKMAIFSREIGQIAGVLAPPAGSSAAPSLGISGITGTSGGAKWTRAAAPSEQATIYWLAVEKGFFPTFGIQFLAGEAAEPSDDRLAWDRAVINEKTRKMLGFPSPEAAVGEDLEFLGGFMSNDGRRIRIVGVVNDFCLEGLHSPVRPTLYHIHRNLLEGFFSMKIEAKNVAATLAATEKVWRRTFPEAVFEPIFLDQKFAAQYQNDRVVGGAFGLFAMLALFVSGLGLLGLAAFSAEKRTKEIGVRKVLGASVAQIVGLLSRDFLVLVAVGVAVAVPIAYFLMEKWLSDFAFRIKIGPENFVVAGLAAIGLAFLTVAFQALKAGLADPVKSLRSE